MATVRAAVLIGCFLASCRDGASSPAPAPEPAAKAVEATGDHRKVFASIYEDRTWGANGDGRGTSGTGSTLGATVVYRAYLQQFMAEHGIKSVVDAGCGDWEFSSALDWTGIDYRGFDIVPAIVARNTERHGKANIHFRVGNIITDDLPPADLLISKDVLQHLPNKDVVAFLGKQLPKYKHVLLTNGVDAHSLSGANGDIAIGDYRPIDLTLPPYSLAALKVLTYWDGKHMHQVVHAANANRP
ncbi:MAG: class I SAM-dependent methyltransferase [Deltaproteobacteria bacterium]|nr:class I SAM-dependent methyltransferase [Deltaproteobacteria bacterium]